MHLHTLTNLEVWTPASPFPYPFALPVDENGFLLPSVARPFPFFLFLLSGEGEIDPRPLPLPKTRADFSLS